MGRGWGVAGAEELQMATRGTTFDLEQMSI